MVNYPKHSNAIDLVEIFFCVLKLKTPVVRGRISITNRLNPVDDTVNDLL